MNKQLGYLNFCEDFGLSTKINKALGIDLKTRFYCDEANGFRVFLNQKEDRVFFFSANSLSLVDYKIGNKELEGVPETYFGDYLIIKKEKSNVYVPLNFLGVFSKILTGNPNKIFLGYSKLYIEHQNRELQLLRNEELILFFNRLQKIWLEVIKNKDLKKDKEICWVETAEQLNPIINKLIEEYLKIWKIGDHSTTIIEKENNWVKKIIEIFR